MEERFLKKAIVHTGFGCNSNCIFCLLESRKPTFFPKSKVVKEISEKRMAGSNWLILTGGEATIFPDFISLVAFAKKIGYERIQVISNGRMLSNERFAKKAADAGLTEATISFHGATPEKHDALVRVPGAFKEASQAALNARKYGIKLSFNTALNKLNALELGDIAEYIHDSLGFEGIDYDIIGTAPSGGAVKNKLMPKHEDVKEGIRKACEYGEKNNLVIWVTRTPIQDMPEGYEYHKEPWEVITHDTLAMWNQIWRKERVCDAMKCEFCEARPFCFFAQNLKRRMDGKLDYVTGAPDKKKLSWASEMSGRFMLKDINDRGVVEDAGMKPFFRVLFDGIQNSWETTLEKIEESKEAGIEYELEFHVNKKSKKFAKKAKKFKTTFSPTNPYPYVKYIFTNSNRLVDTSESMIGLEESLSVKGSWKNVPLCIRKGKRREYSINIDDFSEGGEILPRKIVNRMARDVRVFKWECEECKMHEECPGFFGDYVKIFSFDKITPII